VEMFLDKMSTYS